MIIKDKDKKMDVRIFFVVVGVKGSMVWTGASGWEHDVIER